MTMEDVNKTVTTTLGATPAHATLDILGVVSMNVWVCPCNVLFMTSDDSSTARARALYISFPTWLADVL